MKFIRHKRKLFHLLLAVGVLLSFYCGEMLTFTPMQKGVVGLVFLLGILLAAFRPRQKSEWERFEEADERNQYIAMKCAAETLKVVQYSLLPVEAGCLIAFGLTREWVFIWVLVGAAIPYGILKMTSVILAFQYDR